MFEWMSSIEGWVALLTLTGLEIVLGIDNIVFIAIMVQRVPEDRRKLAYRAGLGVALISRLALLATLSWIVGLKADLFPAPFIQQGISGSLDFQGIVDLVGDKLREVFASRDLYIALLDADGRTARMRYGVEHGVRLPEQSFVPSDCELPPEHQPIEPEVSTITRK